MSAHEGEERLMTVFADVHYYFSAPTPRPAAHRFDKGSYLYFYGNKSGNGGRLEIANNVGKPEQDAFTGSMESTTVHQSHKHPTLCTIVVDGYGSHLGTASPVQQPEHHWRLPNTDPRNEGKYLFRLHTLDIYFWTAEDANAFVAFARKKLEVDQLDVVDIPPTPASHDQAMSPVVQNLENVAIQDPAYHNGQTRSSRTESTGVTSPLNAEISRGATKQGTPKAQIPTTPQPQDAPKAPIPTMFQPLAYNPAAPPAPEPIKHREKTPPPVDDEVGTGLAAAALRDHSQAASPQSSMSRPPYGHPQPSGLFSPQPAQSHTPSLASPQPSASYANSQSSAGYRASSVSSLPPPPPQSGRGSVSPYTPTPSFAAPPQSPSNSASVHSQQVVSTFSAPPQDSMAPFYSKDSAPLESPATEILGDSYVAGIRQPLQHLHPRYADYTPPGHEPPVGGYSNYQYSQQQQQSQQQQHHHHHNGGNEYDVHSQVYRPTEEEAHGRKPSKPSKQPQGRLEQGVENVDKKVNRFFKKLEKKIG